MEGDSLRSTIDIYALQIIMALDDSLACGIVGITAGLAVIPTIPSVGYPQSQYILRSVFKLSTFGYKGLYVIKTNQC